MNTVQRIAKNFLSLSSGEIISRIFSFIAIVYLARILGVENFGKIGFAQAILVYFMIIANLGLTTLGTREIARAKDKISNYVNNIAAFRLVLAVATFCLLCLFASIINKPGEIRYLIIFYGFSLFSSSLLFDWVFKGVERMEYVGISRVLDKLCYFALILLVIKGPGQLLLIPFLWLMGTLVSSGFLIFMFRGQIGKLKLTFDFHFWKRLLIQALPMGASVMLIQIYFNFDIILLGFMKTDREIGWYNAAYKIVLLLISVNKFYFTSIFPVISRYYKESIEKLRIILSSSAKLGVSAMLPLAVGGTILAKPIMDLMYTAEYAEGAIALQILIWITAIGFMCMVYSDSLLACDRQKDFFWGVCAGAVSNIILDIILIPKFSFKGAAVATLISELIVFTFMYRRFKKIVHIPFKTYIIRPVVACVIMGVFLYHFLEWNLFVLIPVGAGIYFGALFIIKGVTRKEVLELKRLSG